MGYKYVKVVSVLPKVGILEHIVVFRIDGVFYLDDTKLIRFDADDSLEGLQDGMYVFKYVKINRANEMILTREGGEHTLHLAPHSLVVLSPKFNNGKIIMANIEHFGYVAFIDNVDRGRAVLLACNGDDANGCVLQFSSHQPVLRGLAVGMDDGHIEYKISEHN